MITAGSQKGSPHHSRWVAQLYDASRHQYGAPQSDPCMAASWITPDVYKPLYLSLLRLRGLDGGDALQLRAARRLLRVHARRPLRHVPQLVLQSLMHVCMSSILQPCGARRNPLDADGAIRMPCR